MDADVRVGVGYERAGAGAGVGVGVGVGAVMCVGVGWVFVGVGVGIGEVRPSTCSPRHISPHEELSAPTERAFCCEMNSYSWKLMSGTGMPPIADLTEVPSPSGSMACSLRLCVCVQSLNER